MSKKRIWLSWSSGKDSAWALHRLRSQAEFDVIGLLTTVNERFGRVAMHGTRREILQAQARAAGLELVEVPLPWPCSNDDYECAMGAAMKVAAESNIEAVAFGDLFLEDIRAYRERQMQRCGLEPLFPLWGLDTAQLAREMIAGGLKARLVCIDPRQLPAEFAGRGFDEELLRDLPAGVDPCGENGEFHTCVYAGPMFSETPVNMLPVQCGARVDRDGFVYCDLALNAERSASL